MAYEKQNTVDYFPHSVGHGRKMFIIRNQFGNDGYAVWFMLLEELGKANNHVLDLSDNTQVLYLCAEFKIQKELFFDIINTLVGFDEFDELLWKEAKVVYSEKFISSIKDAYKRRKNEILQYSEICMQFLKTSKHISKTNKRNSKNEGDIQQSKVDKIIVNKIKVKVYRKFAHLTLSNDEFSKLNQKWNKDQIDNVLDSIENYKKNTNYKSLYLTANKWLGKEFPNTSSNIQNSDSNEPTITFRDNVNPAKRKLPKSQFLELQEKGKAGGYIYEIISEE